MIHACDIRYAFPGGGHLRFPDLEVGPGERWLVHGPSGCGKTTLLHLLCGLRTVSGGRLEVGGQEPAQMSGAARDRWRGRSIGLVLQQPHLIPGLSVTGNLEAARYCAGLPADPKRVREVLGALGVESLARRPVHALSQGQAQRVAVARAVVNRPILILADEPTASLDDEHARAVYHLLEESAARTEATLVVVTHDRRLRDLIPNHLALGGGVGATPGGALVGVGRGG